MVDPKTMTFGKPSNLLLPTRAQHLRPTLRLKKAINNIISDPLRPTLRLKKAINNIISDPLRPTLRLKKAVNNIISDPFSVASAMNTFNANIAANIGREQNPPTFHNLPTCDFIARSTYYYTSGTHPSIRNNIIDENLNKCNFTFHHIGVSSYCH